MAQNLSFHYQSGSSLLHNASASVKFIAYISLNLLFSAAGYSGMLINLAAMIIVSFLAGTRVLRVIKELRAFFWIFLISYISRAHLSDGIPVEIPFLQHSFIINWNKEGAYETLRLILHISNSIISTHILMSTTRLSQLQDGIYRIIRPLNAKFAWTISTMLRIMLGAIPRLLDAAKDSGRRIRLRGLQIKKHPLRYVKAMGLLMLQHMGNLSTSYTASLLLRAWKEDGPASLPAIRWLSLSNAVVCISAAVLGTGSVLL
ncbi:CbiQ family ECF transporter T component [Salinispira pacifica]|uniref:Uncharacterized protein n=1 Tax=Salinispira pacifica TaxID=1307761 RepID=V5WIS6_9SPIO|nr:CbiQ family ECF transporter T component [Salinispira pacifica]AHC15051.1 hypothetical protein L21SP2_1668 [Salinispira pacifica]